MSDGPISTPVVSALATIPTTTQGLNGHLPGGVDRSDPEAFGISDLLMRAVSAGLNQYLKERELFSQVTPEGSLFVVPLFNLQSYALAKDSRHGMPTEHS